ncbi:TetR/AcrR family transcriptional regulator [bacterium]|nr:TetR/AcrR family transcriptional regulator [bacterium]
MNRPTTRKGCETRERIMVCAARLFARQGARGTSIDEILTESGTGKSQFYHYFRDKDELIRSVHAMQIERMLALHSVIFEQLDSWEGFELLNDTVLHLLESQRFQDGCPIGSLASELATSDELVRMDTEQYFDRKKAAIVRGLTAMKLRGELRPDTDVQGLADFVVVVLQGAKLLSKVRRSADCAQASLRHMLLYLQSHRS